MKMIFQMEIYAMDPTSVDVSSGGMASSRRSQICSICLQIWSAWHAPKTGWCVKPKHWICDMQVTLDVQVTLVVASSISCRVTVPKVTYMLEWLQKEPSLGHPGQRLTRHLKLKHQHQKHFILILLQLAWGHSYKEPAFIPSWDLEPPSERRQASRWTVLDRHWNQ
jgi:hypothetical protein